jgi:hypothetical protein
MDIKIKTYLNENDNSYQGFIIGKLDNNIITYDDENINVAIILESDKITLLREASEYKLSLEFSLNKETKGTYLLKDLNKEFDLVLNTSLLVNKDNLIEIKYLINTKEQESYFRLEYEVL